MVGWFGTHSFSLLPSLPSASVAVDYSLRHSETKHLPSPFSQPFSHSGGRVGNYAFTRSHATPDKPTVPRRQLRTSLSLSHTHKHNFLRSSILGRLSGSLHFHAIVLLPACPTPIPCRARLCRYNLWTTPVRTLYNFIAHDLRRINV